VYRRKLMALQVPRRRRQQHLPSRRRTILLNCQTLKTLLSISTKPPLRVLCHHWSPTHGEILFAQLGMRFRSHPLMFIFCQLTVMTRSSPLFGQPSIFLLLTIFTLSITRLPTNTHLHPLLRRQHVQHHQPIVPLKMTMRRKASI
jgi:hypothetical protein